MYSTIDGTCSTSRTLNYLNYSSPSPRIINPWPSPFTNRKKLPHLQLSKVRSESESDGHYKYVNFQTPHVGLPTVVRYPLWIPNLHWQPQTHCIGCFVRPENISDACEYYFLRYFGLNSNTATALSRLAWSLPCTGTERRWIRPDRQNLTVPHTICRFVSKLLDLNRLVYSNLCDHST